MPDNIFAPNLLLLVINISKMAAYSYKEASLNIFCTVFSWCEFNYSEILKWSFNPKDHASFYLRNMLLLERIPMLEIPLSSSISKSIMINNNDLVYAIYNIVLVGTKRDLYTYFL